MYCLMRKIKNILLIWLIHLLPIYQRIYIAYLRHKKINVVFFASSLSQWRYQKLYNRLSQNPKFNVFIVICPCCTVSETQQKNDIKLLTNYFDVNNINYTIGESNGELQNIKKEISPDILFYPQPYGGYYPDLISYKNFWYKLICYYPYAFWTAKDDWSYNLFFHNIAWKLFYPTDLHMKDAQLYSYRKGHNMEIVGYPTADDFMKKSYKDIWIPQHNHKKRLIWAPHFTISSGGLVKQSNFLWMADLMLSLACQYSDRIQFVFKPHPRLFSELSNHIDWGEERAKEYFNLWETMENTQVETGEFVDIFMTSDAMIHDCGSFAVEYHYSENPVMYIAQNFEEQLAEKNDFGRIAMNLHYVGKTKQDIIDFIENVVLNGDDPMKSQRQQFKKDYLLPPNGKTVAENTMDVLLRELC